MRHASLLIMAAILVAALAACDSDDDDNDAADDDDGDDSDDDTDDDAGDDDDDDDSVNPFLGPETAGPYLVGTMSVFFEDTSRPLSCGEGNRTLLTEIVYPASDDAAAWPENAISDYFLGRMDEVEEAMREAGQDPEGQMADLPTGAYRDAPVNPDAPPMPVLLFSHGFSSNRFQSFTMMHYLASHGYVVVSPDHTCNAMVTLTPDGVVLFSPMNVPVTLIERTEDFRFLTDLMLSSPPETLAGRLDTAHVGYFGHSYGGVTATEQAKVEPRVSALIQIAAFGFPTVPEGLTLRSMYYWGRQDSVMEWSRAWHDELIELTPRPKYVAELIDTGHFAFSDICRFAPVMAETANGCGTEERINGDGTFTNPDHDELHAVLNAYNTAFFGAAFFGEPELEAYLLENHWPERMVYSPIP